MGRICEIKWINFSKSGYKRSFIFKMAFYKLFESLLNKKLEYNSKDRGGYMEDIVNEIIKIDKQTKSIRLKTDKLIDQRQAELKKRLYDLEKESIFRIKKESDEIYIEIIGQGEAEVKSLGKKDRQSINDIDGKYANQKEVLAQKLFANLFLRGE